MEGLYIKQQREVLKAMLSDALHVSEGDNHAEARLHAVRELLKKMRGML